MIVHYSCPCQTLLSLSLSLVYARQRKNLAVIWLHVKHGRPEAMKLVVYSELSQSLFILKHMWLTFFPYVEPVEFTG